MADRADSALARGVLARYLKLALRSPDAESHRELVSPHTVDALGRAGLVLGVEVPRPAEIKPTQSDLVASHTRLFGHSLRGLVCPYELEYGEREPVSQAQELSNIRGFYRAFGLEPSAEHAERWDHVAVELEFVELLSMKEAYALETGLEEMYAVTRDASKRFVRHHLGFFGMALASALEAEDPAGFYARIGRLLASFLEATSRELGVVVGPSTLSLSSVEDEGAPMACGSEVGASVESPTFPV